MTILHADDDIDPKSERARFLFARGGWPAFHRINFDIDLIFSAAEEWKRDLEGLDKAWLVWNAHDDWCSVQQRLVESVGWTPLVGCDPRVGKPTNLSKNAIFYDFNKTLKLPFLHPVFVLEFVFLFIDKLAFWHSDLLLPTEKMQTLADLFDELEDGQTCAVKHWHKKRFWRKPQRAWELVGCTTKNASLNQYEVGSGWWSNIYAHINCPDEKEAIYRKNKVNWDHGAGIKYWKDRYGGDLKYIPLEYVEKGHFSPTSHPKLFARQKHAIGRDLNSQLDSQTGVTAACNLVGLDYIKLMSDYE
ncbi:hypothetical protein [Vibrio algarum]|uniref:Uncharacterized protein n=1 Tax=Vibrio algarum TaxID=3020714 RepID=A0ABT4YQF9_9VIBR|nr:hypothetical protein [Vibrio sp. KJ40-1]MDB1123715.1 hypothetical protein [Vibrio sp. KJ40-1]